MPAPTTAAETATYGPWNPGISSQLPSHLLGLSTLFRAEIVDEYARIKHMLDTFIDSELQIILDTSAMQAPPAAAGQSPLGRVLALVRGISSGIACNEYGSDALGRLIEPHIRSSAEAEGYSQLPAQERPVVMNTKGASASGKSTLHPLQKKLAGRIGVRWSDFALISPDIWRKYLLDYATLGDAYKYAGAFTGLELEIIDNSVPLGEQPRTIAFGWHGSRYPCSGAGRR